MKPQYPIYIPSRGRADHCTTAQFLIRDGVDFKIVVVPSEYDIYAERFGADRLLKLPSDDYILFMARNWIKDHSRANGDIRHWQIDDNCTGTFHYYHGKRIPCDSNVAFAIMETFVDRYENIAIAGLNYDFFVRGPKYPFTLNCHVYSCTLVLNNTPFRWRMKYNDDTDMCLQVLTNNWCTVLMNSFMIHKRLTMSVPGGNTNSLYAGDGRLKMARSLEQMWPQFVEVKWRFGRPQHVIKNNWRQFKTPLIRRTDIDWNNLPPVDFDPQIIQLKPVKSPVIKKMINEIQTKQNRKTKTTQ